MKILQSIVCCAVGVVIGFMINGSCKQQWGGIQPDAFSVAVQHNPKARIDHEPCIGIGVGMIILNEKNEMLLIKRRGYFGDGMWANPAGRLEYGETFEQCAIRETKEEVGLDLTDPHFFSLNNTLWPDQNYQFATVLMIARCPADQVAVNCEPDKCYEIGWFALDALPEPLFKPIQVLKNGGGYGKLLQDISITKE